MGHDEELEHSPAGVGKDRFQVVIEAPVSTTIWRDELVAPRGTEEQTTTILRDEIIPPREKKEQK